MTSFKKSWWESPVPEETLNTPLNGYLNFVKYKKWRRPTTNGIPKVKLFAVKRGGQKVASKSYQLENDILDSHFLALKLLRLFNRFNQ